MGYIWASGVQPKSVSTKKLYSSGEEVFFWMGFKISKIGFVLIMVT